MKATASILVLLAAVGPVTPPLPPPRAAENPPPGSALEALERRVFLMGTEGTLILETTARSASLAGSEAAVRALSAAEARLSTWAREGVEPSELERLNRAPVGEPVALSPRLAAELAAAEACRRETGGAFDPGVGPLVEAWGLRSGGRRPDPGELAAARAASVGGGVELGEDGSAVRRRPDVRIEEGGFGKGAALDAALAAAVAETEVRSVWIDLGGQVAVFARPGDAGDPDAVGESVEVAVAHPGDRTRAVVGLRVDRTQGASVATSGNSERGIAVAGERRSHVLDPRTGEPAPDFGSLTVVAPTALRADCLSTGLYVLGPEAALAWAADRPGVEVVVLRNASGGRVEVLATPGLERRLRVLEPAAVSRIVFGTDQRPAADAGTRQRRGARASEAVQAGKARRSPVDRGRRVSARWSHDPEESIDVLF